MAINPNIALGVQPIQQQPNMLAQYAQIMAIRAAQQETEGYEGVKSAIVGGMDAADPRMLQYGKRGIEAFRAAGEGRVKQQDALTKAYVNQRRSLDFVSTPDDLLAHGLSQFNDPVIAPQLKAQGLTPEKLTASFQRQLATEGFESLLKKRAMGLDDWYKDQTSRRNTDVSAAAPMMNAQLNRERFEYDKANPELELVTGDTGFYGRNKRDPNSLVPLGMKPTAPPPPATQPSAVNNLMMTTQPTPSLNALAPTAPPQGAGPTVAAAAAMGAQNSVPKPRQPIRQPVAVMKDGKAVLVPPEQAVGLPPATAFAEKTAEDKAKVNRDLETAIRNLEQVVKPGGLLEKSTGSGAGRIYDASAAFFGKGTEGAIAGAQLAPIADMVLKMVPRFEGPQSNKDVDSYLAAAGKLADTGLPNDVRQGAAKIILKLMKERKGQFEIKGQEGGGGGGASPSTNSDPLGIR